MNIQWTNDLVSIQFSMETKKQKREISTLALFVAEAARIWKVPVIKGKSKILFLSFFDFDDEHNSAIRQFAGLPL